MSNRYGWATTGNARRSGRQPVIAEGMAMRELREPDAFPAIDVGLVRA